MLEVVQISPATIQHTCMNETLYCWTFNFHKVLRQQNSGAVEDFILPYSAVYLRIQKWKNYWNWSTFAKVIVKIKWHVFYGPRCMLASEMHSTGQRSPNRERKWTEWSSCRLSQKTFNRSLNEDISHARSSNGHLQHSINTFTQS